VCAEAQLISAAGAGGDAATVAETGNEGIGGSIDTRMPDENEPSLGVQSGSDIEPAPTPNGPGAVDAGSCDAGTCENHPNGEDVTAPSLVAFSLSVDSVDTTTQAAVARATASLSDDLSGFDVGTIAAQVVLDSPSGLQGRNCSGFATQSGTSATAVCDLAFPAFVEAGNWTVRYVYVTDVVGNFQYLDTDQLQTAGLDSSLLVTSTQDIAPPSLLAFSLSPNTIDTTSQAAVVTATASLSDDLSGFDVGSIAAQVVIDSPSGLQGRKLQRVPLAIRYFGYGGLRFGVSGFCRSWQLDGPLCVHSRCCWQLPIYRHGTAPGCWI
jgi:hypothetical protein